MILHIMVSQNQKKLKAKETTTKTKTPFSTMYSTIFQVSFMVENIIFHLQNVFCNSKMTLLTNFQNSQQC
jgi:hypothetical protein